MRSRVAGCDVRRETGTCRRIDADCVVRRRCVLAVLQRRTNAFQVVANAFVFIVYRERTARSRTAEMPDRHVLFAVDDATAADDDDVVPFFVQIPARRIEFSFVDHLTFTTT